MPEDAELVLAARGISKAFPGVKALDGVDLSVRRGKAIAVLGENGAGKSTLMNILAGVYCPDKGEMLFEGRPAAFNSPREAQEAGISIVFQELNLIPQLTIAENMFLGREPVNRLRLVDYGALHRRCRQILEALHLNVLPTTPVARLRVGEQQLVEIGKALSLDARVIILDEPTSAISTEEAQLLFRLLDRLKKRGVGVIYITHKLDEVARVADDVAILRDGRLVWAGELASISSDQIVQKMVGRDPSDLFQRSPHPPGPVALRVEGLSLASDERPGECVVRDVSFSVRKGEVLGIFGLMGAGRTELLESIFGLHPRRTSGRVEVDGAVLEARSPKKSITAGLVLAPEDRARDGLVLSMNVRENISLASLKRTERMGLLSARRERELAGDLVSRLRIKTPNTSRLVRYLSGGNQQKVVLAKWLARQLKVLLLDEPTRGIDVGGKQEIYALIEELTRQGVAVVLVSSEMPEIQTMADRILVMSEGRKTAEFARGEANEETILRAALPASRIAG